MPLYKQRDRKGVRPIGMRNPLAKLFNREMVRENRVEFTEVFEPCQVVTSKGGAAILVHGIRLGMEREELRLQREQERRAAGELVVEEEETITVKIDVRNFFNSTSRASIIAGLEYYESLRHLAWAAAVQLAPHHGLESGGRMWGEAGEGTTQGDTAAPPWACISWHRWVEELHNSMVRVGGQAIFGMDDGYIQGKPSHLFPAIERFGNQIRENCGLELEPAKCEVFSWKGSIPPQAPPEYKLSRELVGGSWEQGLVVYGVPIGSDKFVEHKLDRKVEEIAASAARCGEVLEGEAQCLYSVLRLSIQQQFDYWLALCHPSQVARAAEKVDGVLWEVLERIAGFRIPREGEEGRDYLCPIEEEVRELQGKSFQAILASLPIKAGGLGIRSQVEVSPAAWIGGLEQAVPNFGGERGFCLALAELVGEGGGGDRWSKLIQSGLRTGRELVSAWETLSAGGHSMAEFLGEELGSPLSSQVEAVGEGSRDGSTRMAITKQVEGLRLKVMDGYLQGRRERRDKARPVWSWPQRDKLTTAWLLALPTCGASSLTTPIYREGLAMVLCLPSPASSCREGERVGGGRMDIWGDQVRRENLAGGDWTSRHDRLKMEIMRMFQWTGVRATCEVWGLFGHLVPQEALAREDVRRQKGVMRPDFRVELKDEATGLEETKLAELKFTCGKDLYKAGVRQHTFKRAVEARAEEVVREYRRKADRMDELLGEEPGRGRVRARLEEFGEVIPIVSGLFNEANDATAGLLEAMACSKVERVARSSGLQYKAREAEKGEVVGELRRQFSVASLRASMSLVLNRMNQVGEGAALVGRRREIGSRLEEERRKVREAQHLARVWAGPLVRRGHFFRD